jgi:Holliday junction resolvase-like predicted endonuclease
MREFRDGDWLVVPHLPERGRVQIHELEGGYPTGYEYHPDDATHLNHAFRVRRSWGIEHPLSAGHIHLAAWKGRLPNLRLPVLNISYLREDLERFVGAVESDPAHAGRVAGVDELFQALRDDVSGLVKSRLNAISNSGGALSFEAVCRRLLQSEGYCVTRTNYYDRAGGDVDFVCTRASGGGSVFESGEVTLFVQVKNHRGETGARAVEQVVDMLRANPEADGCVITAADAFSSDAESLAQQEGIALLTGDDVVRLVLREWVE